MRAGPRRAQTAPMHDGTMRALSVVILHAFVCAFELLLPCCCCCCCWHARTLRWTLCAAGVAALATWQGARKHTGLHRSQRLSSAHSCVRVPLSLVAMCMDGHGVGMREQSYRAERGHEHATSGHIYERAVRGASSTMCLRGRRARMLSVLQSVERHPATLCPSIKPIF